MSPFVHPALFWGGIGLVSIPIIIHLLNRRRFRRLEWAAMEFLLDALRRNRRRIRIEQWILLLLRIAAVFLIVTALARPHLSQNEYSWLSGPFQSEERVFVLDDSLSMGHVDAGRSSLQRGRDALFAACERIALEGGRDPVTILRTSRYETPLFNAVRLDTERLGEVRDFLEGDAIQPTAVRLDLLAMLDHLAGAGRPERGRSISIITDLCAEDWTGGDGALRPELRTALERLGGDENDTTRVILLDVGAPRRENLAVVGFSLAQSQPIAGIPIELRIEVVNHGTRPVRGIGLRLRTEESLVPGPRIDTIDPGKTVTLAIPHTFQHAGPTWIRAEIDATTATDGLLADDARDLVVDVLEAVDVLIVDGEPSGRFGEGESDFLIQALRPPGDVRSGFAPSAVVTANLPQENLDRFGVIVLANVGDLPAAFVEQLGPYVRHGGGLVLFPGDQVEGARCQRLLGVGTPEHPGADLLPATLGEVIGNPDRPAHLTPLFEHPAFRLLGGAGDELFRLVDVARFFVLEVPESSRVIASLTDADTSPFLVERTVGDGKVVLCAAPADLEWSNWPRNPTFLPVVLELLGSMSRPRESLWNRMAGAPIDVSIDLAKFQRRARWRDPDYPRTSEKSLLAANQSVDTGASVDYRFTLGDTRRAGIHTLIVRSVSGEDIERLFALQPDALESDLAALRAGDALFGGTDVTLLRNAEAFLQSDSGRFEISDALLIAFLAVLLVESLFAWLFGHHARRRESASGVSGTQRANPIAQRLTASGGRS